MKALLPHQPLTRSAQPTLAQRILLATMGLMLSTSLIACSAAKDEAAGALSCVPESQMSGIVGGTALNDNDLLAKRVVMLMIKETDGMGVCTGTPISDTVILTAAHCVKAAESSTSIVAVFHSSISCESGFDLPSQSAHATGYVMHKDYSRRAEAKNDLALIKLASPIPAAYRTSRIYDGKSKLTSDEMKMVGYGITDFDSNDSMRLRSVSKSYSRDVDGKDRTMNITFAQRDGKGVCSGDSGGPIFIESNGELQIIGVTSIVMSDDTKSSCRGRSRAMYAPAYADWIREKSASLR